MFWEKVDFVGRQSKFRSTTHNPTLMESFPRENTQAPVPV